MAIGWKKRYSDKHGWCFHWLARGRRGLSVIRCTRLAMELEALVSDYIVLLAREGERGNRRLNISRRKCGEEDTTCEYDVTPESRSCDSNQNCEK